MRNCSDVIKLCVHQLLRDVFIGRSMTLPALEPRTATDEIESLTYCLYKNDRLVIAHESARPSVTTLTSPEKLINIQLLQHGNVYARGESNWFCDVKRKRWEKVPEKMKWMHLIRLEPAGLMCISCEEGSIMRTPKATLTKIVDEKTWGSEFKADITAANVNGCTIDKAAMFSNHLFIFSQDQ